MLTPSAHVDTFTRDNLPPAQLWPVLEFTIPDVQYPARLNAGEALLEETIARHGPDRVALRTPDEQTWSYADVLRRANQIAQLLTEDHGLVPGDRVLLPIPNNPWAVAAWFAVLRAGGVVVTTMVAWKQIEIANVARKVRPAIVIADHRFIAEVAGAVHDDVTVLRLGGDGDQVVAASAAKSGDFTPVRTAADDVALLGPTSGTTGEPKVTMHFHRDILANADTFARHTLAMTENDVVAGSPPLAFTFGLGGLVVFPFRFGASALLFEQASPVLLADAVQPNGVTMLFTAPTGYRAILKEGRADALRRLRVGVSAGEHLNAETFHAVRAASGLRLVNGIGSTEMLHVFISAAGDEIRPGATGKPVPGYRATILDANGDEVPTGTMGRLAVIGPTGCRYLADERQRTYVHNGWNVTGDTFIRDEDGYYLYQARTDNMIIAAGYNIGGPEVESVIDTHPDVTESAVVARPDAEKGSIVNAFVVLRPGVPGDEAMAEEIKAYVRSRLATYKVPRRIDFVEALPRNPSGKLQHFKLRQLAAAQAAAEAAGETAAEARGFGLGRRSKLRGVDAMKVAIVGGGPGGLYFAALMKQLDPSHDVTVWERNAADDTFGFGVVFSDETLGGIGNADRVIAARMGERFARWTDIDVSFGGELHTVGGQGFAAMGRKELLLMLQERARELGVTLHFRTGAPPVDELSATYDLVVGADGLNSGVRARYADVFRPTLDVRQCKYMWLGIDRAFEAFTFIIINTPHGVIQLHGYPYSAKESTAVIEMHADVWRRAGFDDDSSTTLPPGASDERSVARIADLFAEHLDGATLLTNNSRWVSFTTVRNERWYHDNVVLIGDAAHTAHFSIGSGTKLAMEDALELAACLHEQPDVATALATYEAQRRPVVLSTQRAAQASLEWFENIGQYVGQEPLQFTFNLLTRSRRITLENLALRDSSFAWRVVGGDGVPPMFRPHRVGGLDLANRIVVSPMAMYSAVNGMAGDFHLVHLGSKAMGGAGLIMTETNGVSATGRITLGCTGLYTDEHTAAWRRIVDFVHTASAAKIGAQIGHSGRKGSTKLMWEGIDDPLPENGWEPVGPSAIPYGPGSLTPREITRAEMQRICEEFVAAAARADEAGFDLLEVHAAHGYLLSSFLSPIANQRTDEYGGTLENRLRYPLRVFDAVRAAWPHPKPLLIRISAHDWIPGGNTDDDAVEIAAAFVEHGADGIDVSSGQVGQHERPAFGRSYQTPFADKIRNRAARGRDVTVIAVGAVSSYDDANSILLAGRADLVAIGRSHLWDPHWTLHAAADQGYRGPGAQWVAPFRAGSRKPPTSRTDAVRPRLELLTATEPPGDSVHQRWQPVEPTPNGGSHVS